MKKSPYDRLAASIAILFAESNRTGHDIQFQWVPSHCGIAGNELADAEASQAHDHGNIVKIPFSRTDVNTLLRSAIISATKMHWSDPNYRQDRLHRLDPEQQFRLPSRIGRASETLLHRIRLGVAFSRRYLHRIGREDSPNCPQCDLPETLEHILCYCPVYADARQDLEAALQRLDSRPL